MNNMMTAIDTRRENPEILIERARSLIPVLRQRSRQTTGRAPPAAGNHRRFSAASG
jgi:hypothetical protein